MGVYPPSLLDNSSSTIQGAQDEEPKSTEEESKSPLLETSLRPFPPSPVPGQHQPGGADLNVDVHFELDVSEAPVLKYIINGKSFVNPVR